MRRFLLWIATTISTFLTGRPAARPVGWNWPRASTSHSPVPPALGQSLVTPTRQSWGSPKASAWNQLCQHIPSPTGEGRNHPVPKTSVWKDTQSLSRIMEKKAASPVLSQLLSQFSLWNHKSKYYEKWGKNVLSISQANCWDLYFHSIQHLRFTADKIQPYPEHEKTLRCAGELAMEAQCKALKADVGKARRNEMSEPTGLKSKLMMRGCYIILSWKVLQYEH